MQIDQCMAWMIATVLISLLYDFDKTAVLTTCNVLYLFNLPTKLKHLEYEEMKKICKVTYLQLFYEFLRLKEPLRFKIIRGLQKLCESRCTDIHVNK
jgi:hypothetical protein